MKRALHVTILAILLSLAGIDAAAQLVHRPAVGARPLGMGGAFTAVASDANATFYNPAGLAFLEGGEAALMHWRLPQVQQVQLNYATVSYSVGPGAAGFAWTRQSAELEEGPNGSTSTLSENNLLLGYGVSLGSRVAVGVNLSRFTLDSKRGGGAGLGFDFGVLFKALTSPVEWTIGANVKNVAANLDNESIAAIYNLGNAVRYELPNNFGQVLWTLDVQSKRDLHRTKGYSFHFRSGLEYQKTYKKHRFALRGGTTTGLRYGLTVNTSALQFKTHGEGSFFVRNFTVGGGYEWDMFGANYAYVLMQNNSIGNSHRIGLKFVF